MILWCRSCNEPIEYTYASFRYPHYRSTEEQPRCISCSSEPRPKRIIRLWDKHFNPLAMWREGEMPPLNITMDWEGRRVSGRVHEVIVVSDE